MAGPGITPETSSASRPEQAPLEGEGADEYEAALRQIYQERVVLLVERAVSEERLIQLNSEVGKARATLAPIQASIVHLRRELGVLERQAQSAALSQGQLQVLQVEAALRRQRIAQLSTQAVKIGGQLNGLAQEVGSRKQQVLKQQRQADALREEWLRVADPIGSYTRGDHEQALGLMTKLIALDRDFAPAYLMRALAYVGLGRLEEALSDVEQASALDKKSTEPKAVRGLVMARLGRNSEAEKILLDAYRSDRKNSLVAMCRGLGAQHHKEWARAASMYRAAVENAPNVSAPHCLLARLLATAPDDQVRNGEEAKKHAMEAMKLDGSRHWRYLDTLAAALAETRDFTGAIAAQTEAIELADGPSRARCLEHLKLYQEQKTLREPNW